VEKNRRDLRPEAFPSLSWEPQEVAQSLETLYRYVEGEALKANDWYLRKKGPNRRLGQWLRGLAILLTAGAGLVPILSELWQIGRQPMIRPGWSPLLLGLAALFLLLDRFLGGTSSWMRYLAASQAIGDLLRRFRFDWTLQQAACAGQPPDAAHTERLIGLCHRLLAGVDRVVQEETQAWASEFRGVLRQIDEAAIKAARRKGVGAIEVAVTNGDQVSGTWRLRIDQGPEQLYAGKKATLTGLLPGPRQLSVVGEIAGKPVRDGALVQVSEDVIEAVTLTLS
jgi:hypothetical protein